MLKKIDTFKDTHFEPLKVSTMRSPICLYLICIFHLVVICACQQETTKTDLRVETYSKYQRFIEQIANGEFDYGGSVDRLITTSLKLDTLEVGFANWAQDSILALAYDKMGGYLLSEKKYQEARNSYQKALTLYKKKWKDSGHKNILRMYHNIGLSFAKNNDFQKAISYFDSAGLKADLLKPDLLFQNPFRKADCYSDIGAYSNASSFFQVAENWLADPALKGLIKTKSITEFFVSYASNCRKLGDYSKGIEVASKGLHQIENCQDHLPVYFADLYT